jgi:ribonuclease HI
MPFFKKPVVVVDSRAEELEAELAAKTGEVERLAAELKAAIAALKASEKREAKAVKAFDEARAQLDAMVTKAMRENAAAPVDAPKVEP